MLAHFDRAKQEVQAAATIAAAKGFIDKARAVRAYAKLAKDRQLLDRATELRLRAERRMGQLLKEMEIRGEKAGRGGARRGSNSSVGSLKMTKSLGVSDNEAARAKKLAEPSEKAFELAGLALPRNNRIPRAVGHGGAATARSVTFVGCGQAKPPVAKERNGVRTL